MAHPDTSSHDTHQPGEAAARGQDAAHETKRAGEDLGRAARDIGEERAEQGRERAYQSLDTAADRLKDAGDDLQNEDEQLAGALISRAAGGLSGAADYLRQRRTGDLLGDIQDFGRKNPAAFLGLSAAAGLLIARVGRTAAEREAGSAGGRTSDHTYTEG
jgi:ElaB/YqjD/DUF883 family membrane-anchored ribosome-binding protein